MKEDYLAVCNERVRKLKDLWLNGENIYSCKGDIFCLLESEEILNLVDKITKKKIKVDLDLTYSGKTISGEEMFLCNLDHYVTYIRDKYFIQCNELPLLLELSFKNKYADILLSTKNFHSKKNYVKYFNGFRRMFLFNLYDNIRYYSQNVSSKSNMYNFLDEVSHYDFDNDNDIIKIEDIMMQIINNRKDNLYNSFVPHEEAINHGTDFYEFQVESVLNDYYNSKRNLTYNFNVATNDNYMLLNKDKTLLLFNISDKFKKAKKDDKILVEFGIKNSNFCAKVNKHLFRKYELINLYKELSKKNYKLEHNVLSFIDPTLMFHIYNSDNMKWLEIDFEYGYGSSEDIYRVTLDYDEIKKLCELIYNQIGKFI